MRIIYFPIVALAVKLHLTDAQSTPQRKVQYETEYGGYEGTGQYYVNDQTQTCVRDCERGSSLEVPNAICGGIVQESWIQLFHTVSECCSFKLSWLDPNVCVDKSNPSSSGTFKFWADVQSGHCRRDCDPGYAVGCERMPPPVILHDTIGICCSDSLPWVDAKFCDTRSIDTSSGGWVVDWLGEQCVKDCDPANGPPCANHQEPTEQIFDTPQQCCQSFSWINTNTCVGKSLGSGGIPPGPSGPNPTPSYPTVPSPSQDPLSMPSQDPLTSPLTCQTDSDCNHVCQGSTDINSGTCQLDSATIITSRAPTPAQTSLAPTSCELSVCTNPKTVPDKCELEILIDEMELVFSAERRLFAQSIRAAFHDAGTFNRNNNEGGANGCLMNDPLMRLEGENFGLDVPLNNLQFIKDFWIDHPSTCLDVSSADILQFAAFFAVVRQSGLPGEPLTQAKRNILTGDIPALGNVVFQWGRPDETECETFWTGNLPGFSGGGGSIPARCTSAGEEIKEKMMDANGFTALEATALIGAHTIGVIRNTFGASLAGPWVLNGDDVATPEGPVFDNAYHDFLINTILANDANAFGANTAPFTSDFGTWFRDDVNGLDHLDSDIALAFPTLDASRHPNFHDFTVMFASDNAAFLEIFFLSLDKMSKLGVLAALTSPGECECSPIVNRRALFEDARRRALQYQGGVPLETLNTEDMTFLVKKQGNATAYADVRLRKVQNERKEEIRNLTTLVPPTPAPTPTAPPTPAPTPAPTLDVLQPTPNVPAPFP